MEKKRGVQREKELGILAPFTSCGFYRGILYAGCLYANDAIHHASVPVVLHVLPALLSGSDCGKPWSFRSGLRAPAHLGSTKLIKGTGKATNAAHIQSCYCGLLSVSIEMVIPLCLREEMPIYLGEQPGIV